MTVKARTRKLQQRSCGSRSTRDNKSTLQRRRKRDEKEEEEEEDETIAIKSTTIEA